jgi:hypothetical protein
MPRRPVAVLSLAVTALVAAACGSAPPTGDPPSQRTERPAADALATRVLDTERNTLYTAAPDARPGRTRVALRGPDGTRRAATVPGTWVIPAVAPGTTAGAISGDGGTLALAGPSGEGTSTFALLKTGLSAGPTAFTLRGRFSFDALAPDGRTVYLIEHGTAGHYRVRAYDADKRRLLPGAIVEKGETDPDMTGTPVAREIGRGGSPVYTLYRGGAEGAFVHALDTRNGIAICVDLPADGQWRLQWTRGGRRLHAVDTVSGRRVTVA